MLALQRIYKSFRETPVLEDITFAINPGEVVALIGENGAGKTTLLNIISGKTPPDSGSVLRHNESIGFVAQDPIFKPTIKDSFGASTEPWRIEHALDIVNLRHLSLDMKTSTLSGGQRTRLEIATVLTQDPEPTILLLDEPTNNLDSEGLGWLVKFIRRFSGGIVLVSHDRSFINQTATKVIELRGGLAKQYGGNYDFYSTKKEEERRAELDRYQLSIREHERVKKMIRDAQARAHSGLRRSKPKDNDKAQYDWHQNNVQRTFSARVKGLQSRLKQLEDIEPPEISKDYGVPLTGIVPPTKLLLRLENINMVFSRPVLSDINLEIRGKERIHLTGSNGNGKTTLLKISAGLLQPNSGLVLRGASVRIGYFSQDVNSLDYLQNGYENLLSSEASPTRIYREARSLGLTKEALRKLPGELSRGQQAKLSFAKLLLGPIQLLILDEPTNHLDIPTRENIEKALQNYNGAILLASHDDYFVRTLDITKQLKLQDGELKAH